MGFDSTLNWIMFGVLAAAFIYRLAVVQTVKEQQNMVLQFWQRVGLPMGHEGINDALRRRLRRSANAAVVGALAGAGAACAVHLYTQIPWLSFTFMWAVALPAVFLGSVAFDVALTLRDSLFGQRPDAPRTARLEAVELVDYMSPLRLRTAPALLIIAAGLALAHVVLGMVGMVDPGGLLRGPAIPFFLASTLMLAFCTVTSRKILKQPQPAADTLELAWDDAVRADVFRKLGLLGSVLAWLAVTGMSIGLLGGLAPSPAANMAVVVAQSSTMVGYSIILCLFTYGSSFSWFRKRLWPNFSLQPSGPAASINGQDQSHGQEQSHGQPHGQARGQAQGRP